jgi:hypothetical protein
MKKSITRLIVLVLSLVALVAFAGCELTGTDSFDSLTTDSRKGKPQTVTTNVTTPPPVYEGTEGNELDLDVEDYIETFYAVEDVVFTSYAEPFEFTPYAIVEFTPYDPIVFSPYAEPFEFTPYSSVDFTAYSPELFFYYDEGEKVFVSEEDPLATHKITGFDTTGYNTTGFNTTGYDTTGFNTIGFNTIGERIVGWESSVYGLWAGQDNDAGTVYISNNNENFYITIDTNSSSDLQEVHIYVYEDQSALPDKRPAPGQAPYVEQNIYADSVTVTIPISELVNLEDYYFAIHAALVDDAVGSDDGTSLAGETAYAAGDDTPDYNGKGAWYYVVGYNLNAIIEYITEDVYEDVHVDVHVDVYADVHEDVIEELETDDNSGNGTNYFPVWGQAISHVTLIFDQVAGDSNGDSYYTVKIDEWPDSADPDLDASIAEILAFLVANDPYVSSSSVLLGSTVKGGLQITSYFAYGNGSDVLPSGLGFSLDGTKGNERPQNAIDRVYNYSSVYSPVYIEVGAESEDVEGEEEIEE